MAASDEIRFEVSGAVDNAALNALYAASWPQHESTNFTPLLTHCLAYVCAYDGERLAGWAYVAWDGWQHAFLLDPTVHPDYRRRGIGVALVRRLTEASRDAGCEWLHVDFDADLAPFYQACGFEPTPAGLISLR